ncbi:MAG: ParA family protein [Deltaproteobacteria bacterium]|nr:ParA family protein [Deltaproteobacteria bacterium]
MRRIAFVNEKGGSCKTTLTVNVGAYFALFRRRRVLIVDCDSQGHVGKSLGLDVRGAAVTSYELMADPGLSLAAAAQPSRITGLDVVLANKRIADLPLAVASRTDREVLLEKKVSNVDGYDFILYDAPPSSGLVTRNILLASDEVVVPVSLTYLALDGCAEIVDTVRRLGVEHKRSTPRISLVVPTLYRNTNLATEIIEKLKAHFPGRVTRGLLGFNVKIDEAQSHGQTIWEYAPQSSGAAMLEQIAKEIERVRVREFHEQSAPEPAA